jgi:hypothetical protein
MTYDNLITTISEIVNNTNIYKTNLKLSYTLSPIKHRQMSQELYIKLTGNITNIPKPTDVFEVEIEGLIIEFVKGD